MSALCSQSHTRVIHLKQCLVHLWCDHLDNYIREAFKNIQMLHRPQPLDCCMMPTKNRILILSTTFCNFFGDFAPAHMRICQMSHFFKASLTTCSKSTISTWGNNQISDNDVTIDAQFERDWHEPDNLKWKYNLYLYLFPGRKIVGHAKSILRLHEFAVLNYDIFRKGHWHHYRIWKLYKMF